LPAGQGVFNQRAARFAGADPLHHGTALRAPRIGERHRRPAAHGRALRVQQRHAQPVVAFGQAAIELIEVRAVQRELDHAARLAGGEFAPLRRREQDLVARALDEQLPIRAGERSRSGRHERRDEELALRVFHRQRTDVRQAQQDGHPHFVQLGFALAQAVVVVVLEQPQHLLHDHVVALEDPCRVLLGRARQLVKAAVRGLDCIEVTKTGDRDEKGCRQKRSKNHREAQPYERALGGRCARGDPQQPGARPAQPVHGQTFTPVV
jgi:hypothetical protein